MTSVFYNNCMLLSLGGGGSPPYTMLPVHTQTANAGLRNCCLQLSIESTSVVTYFLGLRDHP